MSKPQTTIEQLRQQWMAKGESFFDELAGVVQDQIREGDRFTVKFSMTVDGKRMKFSAGVSQAAAKAMPREEMMKDPAQERLEGLE